MTETWNHLEGVSLAGKYTLEKLLGGDEHDGFFLTRLADGTRAVLEAVPLGGEDGERRLRAWRVAAAMSHPNLMRILDTGRTQAGGPELAYAVMEFPDEDLGGVLRDRALTKDEARDALASLAAALAYLHSRGVAHGEVEPGNIAAVGNAIRLSSNNLRPGGRQADDVRALGLTVYEMLTRRRDPETRELGQIPEPFRAIVRGTVHEGWTLDQVSAALSPEQPKPVVAPRPPAPAPAAPPPGPARPERSTAEALPVWEPTHERPHERRTPLWVFGAAAVVVLVVVLLAGGRRAGETRPAPEPPTRSSAVPPATTPATPARPSPMPTPPAAPRMAPEASRSSEPHIWRVVAYTFSRHKDAAKKVEAINRKWPGAHASVFSIDGKSGPFMVALGGRMTRAEAAKLQRTAVGKGLPRDTFVRNFSR